MKDFRTRKKQKRPFFYSWFFLLFLFVVLGLFAKSAYASFAKKRSASLERAKYESRVQELLNKKEDLESRIDDLKTERGAEEALRKRFNIAKEGETVIRIIDESTPE